MISWCFIGPASRASITMDSQIFDSIDIPPSDSRISDDNAFTNASGMIRPSARATNGDPRFSIADEVRMEAAMGRGDSYVTSGQQWGA
jgi:hypothetical protein